MIDKRIGERIKQCREQLGLTQEQFAERLGLTTNYISTVERGASFPRCEKLIAIINGLETSADAIFCDVITHTSEYRSGILSEELKELPAEEQQRILEIVELMKMYFCQSPHPLSPNGCGLTMSHTRAEPVSNAKPLGNMTWADFPSSKIILFIFCFCVDII